MNQRRLVAVLATVFLSGGLLLIGGEVQAGVRSTPNRIQTENIGDDLGQCIAQNRKLSILFLVDESKSLIGNPSKNKPGNDPFGLRVRPMRAIAAFFARYGEDFDFKPEVTASVYGFGAGFIERKSWGILDSESKDQFEEAINGQGTLNQDLYTRYHVALRGVLDAYSSDPNGPDSCRLAFWFSDGQHDDDDDSGFSVTETNQIRSQLCSSGGIADQLRLAKIRIWALGLNPDPNQTELMKLIATNDGSFTMGKETLSSGSCGSETAIGAYNFALNTSEIGKVLENLPGIPKQDVQTKPCASTSDDCREIRFAADESLTGFTVLVSRPVGNLGESDDDIPTKAFLIPPSADPIDLFAKEAVNAKVDIQKTSDYGVLVSLSKSLYGSLEGDWAIRFEGEGADDASGRVRFRANATVALTDDKGATVEVIDRFDPKPLRISVINGKVFVKDLKVSLSSNGGEKEIEPSTESATEFSINPKDLGTLLQAPPLNSALAAKLSIDLIGEMPGLTGPNGEAIPVEFAKVTAGFGITNGAKYPAYLPGTELTQQKIKDIDPLSVVLRFRGPDAVDGVVRVIGVGENTLDREFKVGGKQECRVPAQTEVECTFTISPTKNGYGRYVVPVRIELDSSEAEKAQEQLVELDLFLTRSPDVGKGIKNAILLILLFVLVQTVVRAISALSLSRFSALDPTARRVKMSVQVGSDGAVSGTNGGMLVAPEPGSLDNNFAIEVLEKQNAFDLFGYSFRSSAVRTFFRSTVRECLGYASAGGMHVFGSAGTKVIKKGTSEGAVELSLRRQWVIGITPDQLFALANGAMSAEADLVAIFDPYEKLPLDQQLSDLQFAIGASQFGKQLHDAMERIWFEPEPLPDSVDPFATEVPDAIGESTPFDPFGSTFSAATTPEEPKQRRGRKERRSRNESDSAPSNDGFGDGLGGSSGDPFDPFA
jgi:hypothetical protein